MQNSEKTCEWMCEGTTYLLAKNNDTKNPTTYWSITCFSTTYKLLTLVLADRTYFHLEQNDIFPLEQKGCRRGLYGCKDQCMINKMILENCKKRKRNLNCAWIDYKKVFDSVPRDWILRSPICFTWIIWSYTQKMSEREGLSRIVKRFSDNIGMGLGLSKCNKATFKRDKLEKYVHEQWDEETMIQDLEQEKVYRYLGVDESSRIQHVTMKQILKKELIRRT